MIEQTILSNLITYEEFLQKVFPFLKEEYFGNPVENVVFKLIEKHVTKYKAAPNKTTLEIDLSDTTNLNDQLRAGAFEYIQNLNTETQKLDWLLDNTENFCKDRAIELAMHKSLAIITDKKGKQPRSKIVDVLQDALAVSFDTHLGHDYLEDFDKRFDYYTQKLPRVPFDIDILNKATGGGLPGKTLTVLIGGVHMGKTASMCHMAAANMVMGKNVLYFTMEMSEEEIGKRIDANLLDISIEELNSFTGVLSREAFKQKMINLRRHTVGKLFVKEYPGGCASVTHFRAFLNELLLKKKCKPDIIYIDYLNLCLSSRIKFSAELGTYNYVKFIADEIRGMAVQTALPIVSATQLTRSGFKSSDPGMDDTSESFALPAIADVMWFIIVNDDLENLGQIMIKQEKNRLAGNKKFKRFIVGRDLDKMRLFDVENPQAGVMPDQPVFDNTAMGEQDKKIDRKKLFEDFK